MATLKKMFTLTEQEILDLLTKDLDKDELFSFITTLAEEFDDVTLDFLLLEHFTKSVTEWGRGFVGK